MKSALRAERDALRVVRIGLVFHDAGDLLELTADFHNDGLRRALHSAHGERGEDEREHRADEETDQNGGAREREVQNLFRVVLHDVDVGDEQRKSGQRSRADRKALAGSGRGVAQRVESVGALADFLGETGHLGDAAGVVGHGAVSVGRESDAERGEHADAGDADAVQTLVEGLGEVTGAVNDRLGAARGKVADENGGSNDQNGGQRGLETEGDAADDDRGRAGLGSRGELPGGLIGVGGVILGEVADGAAADQTAEDGDVNAPARLAEKEKAEGSGEHGGENGRGVGAGAETLEQSLLGSIFLRLDEEGADDGADDADNGESHGQQHTGEAVAADGAQREGGENGADVGLVQVSAHTGNVADVVADVIGDGGGVARVVLGDTGFDLADKVSADVCGLGVDTAADAGEERHEGSAHAVHDHDVAELHGIINAEGIAEQEKPDGDIQHAETDDGEAHNGTGGERHAETLVQALGGGLRGTRVGARGDLHADETGEHRPDAARDERERGKLGEHFAAGGKSDHQQNHEHDGEDLENGGVLTLQISVGTFTNGSGKLLHLFGAFGIAHDFLCLKNSKETGNDSTDEADPKQFVQLLHSSNYFLLGVSGQR